jgi:hypothetical protein
LDGDSHLFNSFQNIEYVVAGNGREVGEGRRRKLKDSMAAAFTK